MKKLVPLNRASRCMLDVMVSIAVPTFNRREDLARCLDSLRRQQGCTHEIIVVDDGSTDGTKEMIEARFPEVRFFREEGNRGPGYARNVAIRAARGIFVLFLDSDTCLQTESLLAQAVSFFDSHPETGTVGGELRVYEADYNFAYGRSICFNGDSASACCPNVPGEYRRCDFLATCCCMVRRKVAIQAGGFDPYFGFGGEDKDFGYRIQQLGYENYISADCAVSHHHSPHGRAVDETYRYQKTRLLFVCKNSSLLKYWLVCVYWLMLGTLHQATLPLRIFYQVINGNRLTQEQRQGGRMIIRAIVETLANSRAIRARKKINFLSNKQMEIYKKIK